MTDNIKYTGLEDHYKNILEGLRGSIMSIDGNEIFYISEGEMIFFKGYTEFEKIILEFAESFREHGIYSRYTSVSTHGYKTFELAFCRQKKYI